MSFEKVIEILGHLKSEGVRIVIFEGGEPMLWKDEASGRDISHVIDHANKMFYFTGITTNGTMDLSAVSPDIFFISIDGLDETYSSIRGAGFKRIVSNIEKNNKNKKIIANICISRVNLEQITAIVRFLNEIVFGITIQFFYPYEGLPDLKLSGQERISVLDELLALKSAGYRILDSYSCLKKMRLNTWRCSDFLVANVEANGIISYGCYLKNRVENVSCRDCGFAVHCEISLAYNLDVSAIRAAKNIFWDSINLKTIP